eukprot:1273632-Ditylum_brightwellii.AAC.1
MRRFDVLLQEYEGVRNWDVNVQNMASTKKSKWKLMMDCMKRTIRLQPTQGKEQAKVCVEGEDTLKGTNGKAEEQDDSEIRISQNQGR